VYIVMEWSVASGIFSASLDVALFNKLSTQLKALFSFFSNIVAVYV